MSTVDRPGPVFADRREAGRALGNQLLEEHPRDPVVLALPRGGVPVGFEVARALGAPLEVFVARKIGAPHQPELGIGAVAEGGVVVADGRSVRALGLSDADFDALARREAEEVERRVQLYRAGRPLPDLEGRTAVLVDDGLATGSTAVAALVALRRRSPAKLILAAPVCARDTVERLRSYADDVICVVCPARFGAVGAWYRDFTQTSDTEVEELLNAERTRR